MLSRKYNYVLGVLGVVLSLHFILSFTHEEYGRLSSISSIKERISPSNNRPNNPSSPLAIDQTYDGPPQAIRRANATLVMLCRNNDLAGVVTSIQRLEDRWNRKYRYPWVLLNEEPFTDKFKQRVSILTSSNISFGIIPRDHWFQPDWIDEKLASENRKKMSAMGMIYADSVSYRNMCRFNSGFFYHHPLLQNYRYYWRVEPSVTFFCDLNYDPLLFMQDNKKVYGFTIALLEWQPTIASLWSAVKEYMNAHPEYLPKKNSLEFLSDNRGDSYNLCHYWSNFEIADMDFWRGPAYDGFFKHLDSKGGFYYERWGDAPIHSIAASLFAERSQVHFFSDIGYRHDSFQHCPRGDEWSNGRCACDSSDTFDYHPNSCLKKYEALFK